MMCGIIDVLVKYLQCLLSLAASCRVIYEHYLLPRLHADRQTSTFCFCSLVFVTIFVATATRVGPRHCCYRIGPIRFLAGWHKRRSEAGLVRFHWV